jgi:hypothetical protein
MNKEGLSGSGYKVMEQMNFIGVKITEGAISFLK